MFSLKMTSKPLFQEQWRGNLAEYVNAIVWSSEGILAAASAAGEVVFWHDDRLRSLETNTDLSIDCLDFSADGQYLAAGGQNGKVRIWKMYPIPELIASLDYAPKWIDRLSWSPIVNQLAFSAGRFIYIWDAETQTIETKLFFAASSVLGMSWRSNGEHLAIAGDRGLKVWNANNWHENPYTIDLPSASIAVAWSGDGKYLASSNFDLTISVCQWGNSAPWVMRGFPGKIRNLAWSSAIVDGEPILASSSVEGIVIWEKQKQLDSGWDANILDLHNGTVQDLAFQANKLVLASADNDGWLCIWLEAKHLAQILEGVSAGFSCLSWHPQGTFLAGGGQNGELIVWTECSVDRPA